MPQGRRRPYTAVGIRQVRCAKAGCNKPSVSQWQVCADGNVYRGLCAKHDVALNRVVMRWFFGKTREANLKRYALEKLAL